MHEIPIQNLYYLLCYAWRRPEEAGLVNVQALPAHDLPNLFARVLVNGTRHLCKQGLDRAYVEKSVVTSALRGKIDLSQSIKRQLFRIPAASCTVDELTVDVLHNQILKATLVRLARTSSVAETLKHELSNIVRGLDEISDIRLSGRHFQTVQLHRNNAFYRFLLSICEIVYSAMLIEDAPGAYRFRDFIRDEKVMRRVFQDFVFNFYLTEQSRYQVYSEIIKWRCTEGDDAMALLPRMETDVSLESPERKIIIETKFTDRIFNVRFSSERPKYRSAHLYQLFAYLKNLSRDEMGGKPCEGLLLYPQIKTQIRNEYQIAGHRLRIATVDLRAPWRAIHGELMGLIDLPLLAVGRNRSEAKHPTSLGGEDVPT